MNPVETNVNNIYNNMGYSSVPPSSIKTAATEALILPPYNSITADSLPQKTAMNSDSGLTYNVPLRKRSRDSRDYSNSINFAFQNSYLPPSTAPQNNKSCASSSFSFLGEDISLQIQRQQLDIDQLIAQQVSNNSDSNNIKFYFISTFIIQRRKSHFFSSFCLDGEGEI